MLVKRKAGFGVGAIVKSVVYLFRDSLIISNSQNGPILIASVLCPCRDCCGAETVNNSPISLIYHMYYFWHFFLFGFGFDACYDRGITFRLKCFLNYGDDVSLINPKSSGKRAISFHGFGCVPEPWEFPSGSSFIFIFLQHSRDMKLPC